MVYFSSRPDLFNWGKGRWGGGGGGVGGKNPAPPAWGFLENGRVKERWANCGGTFCHKKRS